VVRWGQYVAPGRVRGKDFLDGEDGLRVHRRLAQRLQSRRNNLSHYFFPKARQLPRLPSDLARCAVHETQLCVARGR
jgi:hypothetical protein